MTATAAVRAFIGNRNPAALIVLGSGLGDLADHLEHATRLPYRDIPGFPIPTVEGHKGELVLGRLGGRDVLAQSGRFHMYEGHDAATSALCVRTAAECGIGTVLLTNAAGGIRRTFRPGTLMLITDQINLQFQSPLVGAVRKGEERFPDMSGPYDPALRAIAREVARARGVQLEEGVYAGLLGPSYETPAEVRMLERLGADVVGMSTVAEVLAARTLGLRCMGISTVTNLASGIGHGALSHAEVMETANAVRNDMVSLFTGIVERLD
ncbi:MAG: inosine guanosine and xanthosine phosphorylase family [Gemmatimonadetes bacterium]|nr:inosine guanosine and xanthosine phosphorylase family [Gemmatimonadota bacterium]